MVKLLMSDFSSNNPSRGLLTHIPECLYRIMTCFEIRLPIPEFVILIFLSIVHNCFGVWPNEVCCHADLGHVIDYVGTTNKMLNAVRRLIERSYWRCGIPYSCKHFETTNSGKVLLISRFIYAFLLNCRLMDGLLMYMSMPHSMVTSMEKDMVLLISVNISCLPEPFRPKMKF
jgi:hypothetical protein